MLEIPKECHEILLHKYKYIQLEDLPPMIHADTTNRTMDDDIKLTKQLDDIELMAPLSQFLSSDEDEKLSDFVLDAKAMKYYEGLDIRRPESRNSSCFTKR